MMKLIVAAATIAIATAILVIAFGPSLSYWPHDSNNVPLQPAD
jgi:hypothetical protein